MCPTKQTCRRCFRLSKLPALWLQTAKWITALHPNILTLGKPINSYSSEEVEALVIQAARVERGWSRKGSDRLQPAMFRPEPGWVAAVIPGGRWFISGTADGSGRVLLYDLENPASPWRILLRFNGLNGADARELTLQMAEISGELSFRLAVVFGSSCACVHLLPCLFLIKICSAHYVRSDTEKRVMTLWRVTIDELSPSLSSHLQCTIDVYQNPACRQRSLSLIHEHIARVSSHGTGATVLSLYSLDQPISGDPKVMILAIKPEVRVCKTLAFVA